MLSSRIEIKQIDLDDAQKELRLLYSNNNKERVNPISSELLSLLDAEVSFQKQMARDEWMKLYDRNTKFFHNIIRSRRRRSMILSLGKEDSVRTLDMHEIAGILTEGIEGFYGDCFSKK